MSHSGEANPPSGNEQRIGDDWWGLGDLLVLAMERLTAPVEGMHRVIADRWLGLAGPGAAPVRRAYQAFTARVYGSVRLTGSALGTAVGLGAAAAGGRNGLGPLWRSSRGSGIRAAVNALWGDELERRGLREAQGLFGTAESAHGVQANRLWAWKATCR